MRLRGGDGQVGRRKDTRPLQLWLVHVHCSLDVVKRTKPEFLQTELPVPNYVQTKKNSKETVGDASITTFDL